MQCIKTINSILMNNDEFIPELMYALMTSIVDYIPEAVGDLKAAFESNVQ